MKTDESSRWPIPIPDALTDRLTAHVLEYPSKWVISRPDGEQYDKYHLGKVCHRRWEGVSGLPKDFSFHALRHFYASYLIASGADIKTVQRRMRHALAGTTLNTYGHLWPDRDETTRDAIAAIIRPLEAIAET